MPSATGFAGRICWTCACIVQMHFLSSLSLLPFLSAGLTKKETSLYVSLIFANVVMRAEEAAHKYKVQLFIFYIIELWEWAKSE